MFEPFPGFDWLNEHASGWQFGEAGILQALTERVGGAERFAEVGAGDGERLPVTLDFAYSKAYRLDLWEANDANREKLKAKYPRARITGKCRSLFGMESYADGVVVIDVDGSDYWLFASLLQCDRLPKIVMVEHRDRNHGDQACSLSITKQNIGEQANWEQLRTLADGLMSLVGITRVNSIFVRNDLVELAKGL